MSLRAARQGAVAEAEDYEEVEYEDDEEYDEEDDEEVDEDEEEEDFDGQIEEGELHGPVNLICLRRVASYLSWPYQGCNPIVLLYSACTGFAVDEESEDEPMQHFAPARAQAMRTGKCRLNPAKSDFFFRSFELRLLTPGGAASPAQVTRAWGGIQNLPVSEVYVQNQT